MPTLEELGTAVDTAKASYVAAQTAAATSSAQAATDSAAEAGAHLALRTSIDALVAAAEAVDPDAPAQPVAPATP